MALELDKSLQAVSDLFLQWFDCRNPGQVSDHILAKPSNSAKLKQIMRLLLVTYLITLVIQLPVLKTLGIELTTLSFQLPAFLSFIFVALSTALALHASLKLFKIPSILADTWAIYVSHTAILAPIQIVFSLPSLMTVMRALTDAKRQNLDFVDVIAHVWKVASTSGNNALLVVAGLLNLGLVAVSFCLYALIADKVSQHFHVPRGKAYSAMGFAISVCIPIVAAVPLMLYYFDVYSNIGK